MKFPKDTRVMREFYRYENSRLLSRGVTTVDSVIDPLSGKEKTLVKWDRNHFSNQPQEVYTDILILESEGDEKYSKLQKEFEALEEECKKKIEVAAEAIAEADRLASAKGYALSSMHEAVGSLIDAMGSAGWSTSSWSC